MARNFVIDLFCGAGGASLGFSKTGCKVVLGIDSEEIYKETYEQITNMDGSRPMFLSFDLSPCTPLTPGGQLELAEKHIVDTLKSNEFCASVDKLIFIVCAPCQPFSKLGRNVSLATRLQREIDRGLLLGVIGTILKFEPDAIFSENVPGIRSVKNVEKSVNDEATILLSAAGYETSRATVNAMNFGIPQSRLRSISISIRRSNNFAFKVPTFDVLVARPVTVKEAIGHYPPLIAGECHAEIPNHNCRELSALNLLRLSSVKPGEDNTVLATTNYGDLSLECHRSLQRRDGFRARGNFSDTYTRMDPEGVSPTITTNCISVSNGRFGHYDQNQNRGISVREAAALQSFPDSFKFFPLASLHPAATMVGNAVPPRLAEFFARNIIQELN